jgi:hypothetical protein
LVSLHFSRRSAEKMKRRRFSIFPSWTTRREVIRAVVKQVDIGDEEVRIVYRVPPVPFVERSKGSGLQHCGRRPETFPRTSFVATERSPLPSPPARSRPRAAAAKEHAVECSRRGSDRLESFRPAARLRTPAGQVASEQAVAALASERAEEGGNC